MASDSTKSAEDEARQKKCNSYLKRTRPVGMAEAAAPVPHTHPVSLGAGFAPPPIGANPALPGMFGSAATTDTSGSNPSGSAPYQSSTRILAAVPPQIDGRLQCCSCGGIYSKASPDYICHKRSQKGPKCVHVNCHCGEPKSAHSAWMPAGPWCNGGDLSICPRCGVAAQSHPSGVDAGWKCDGKWLSTTKEPILM